MDLEKTWREEEQRNLVNFSVDLRVHVHYTYRQKQLNSLDRKYRIVFKCKLLNYSISGIFVEN